MTDNTAIAIILPPEVEAIAKQDAEAAENTRLSLELKAKQDAEKKAAKAPDKEKLTNWINAIDLQRPPIQSKEYQDIAHEILMKFNAFKLWAINKINEL
jgi:hypothetical protein